MYVYMHRHSILNMIFAFNFLIRTKYLYKKYAMAFLFLNFPFPSLSFISHICCISIVCAFIAAHTVRHRYTHIWYSASTDMNCIQKAANCGVWVSASVFFLVAPECNATKDTKNHREIDSQLQGGFWLEINWARWYICILNNTFWHDKWLKNRQKCIKLELA